MKKVPIKMLLPLGVLGLLFVGVFVPLPPHEHGRIRDYLHDLGHFPACILAFWALYQIPQVKWRRWDKGLVAALVVTVVQTLIEVLQPLVGRSASVRDWTLGFAGTLFALGVHLLLRAEKRHHQHLLGLKLLALLVFALLPLVLLIQRERAHVAAFPMLGSFETRAELTRWDLYGLAGELSDDYVAEGEKSVRFTVTEEFSYPGLFMEERVTDWSGYSALRADVYLEGTRHRDFTLRVDDVREQPAYADRGQFTVRLIPGFNSLAIPLAEVMKTDSGRVMDATHIHRFGLFLEEKKVGDVFYLDNLRLVR